MQISVQWNNIVSYGNDAGLMLGFVAGPVPKTNTSSELGNGESKKRSAIARQLINIWNKYGKYD